MSVAANLTNHFLIAMPGLQDPNFCRTVTYLCEHNAQGAMGIVVNRQMDIQLGDILEQMQITCTELTQPQQPVYIGGPVSLDRGFVLHSSGSRWNSTLEITTKISITTSQDILEAMACGRGPARTLVALGYAGWSPGQLEKELSANAWLSGPADPAIIFDLPVEQRWHAAARLLGVNLDTLSSEAGHA
jgi:putative transcriptional regulator